MSAVDSHPGPEEEPHGIVKATEVAQAVKKGVSLSRMGHLTIVHFKVDLQCGIFDTAAHFLPETVIFCDRGRGEEMDGLRFWLKDSDSESLVEESDLLLLYRVDKFVGVLCKDVVEGVYHSCVHVSLDWIGLIFQIDVLRETVDVDGSGSLPGRYFLPELSGFFIRGALFCSCIS